MKKRKIMIAALGMAFLLTACGNGAAENEAAEGAEIGDANSAAEEETQADSAEDTKDTGVNDAESPAGENDGGGNAADAESMLESMTIDYSEAVAMAISKEWNVEGEEEGYLFSADGSGEHRLEGETERFQYTCGFDEENNILVRITAKEREETYKITTDETGYGIYLEAMEGAEGIAGKKLLTPADLKILDIDDAKVTGILGVWEDDGGNRYEFTKGNEFLILTAEGNNGTFCAAEKEDGILEISILVAGGNLRYEYGLQDNGQTLQLYNRDAESYYYWNRNE